MTALLWFTQDLRLEDNPALNAALRDHDRVVALYVFDERNPWAPGGASRWWLHKSLEQLSQQIKARGGKLILRRGPIESEVTAVAQAAKAECVYFSRAYEPWLAERQQSLHDCLDQKQIKCRRFGGRLLMEPDHIHNQQGKPFQVFTPYFKHCQTLLHNPQPTTEAKLTSQGLARTQITSDALSSWQLLPQQPNWAVDFPSHWQPGSEGAQARLSACLTDIAQHYVERRDFPGQTGTTGLSPHLHFGEISPRQIWHTLSHAPSPTGTSAGSAALLRQLMWREFSYYLLHHWPQLPEQPFKAQFSQFPWRSSEKLLQAWQRGQTGYPIVDAGMRELWHTGWMHNRVRMIVASFLCKHLRIHWLEGARWFWDTLLDADLANNSAGWQWVAGSGADAAPYFRIFNPVLQSEKFDPKGEYLRQWVPELARLSNRDIHQPWQADPVSLKDAQVQLGRDYPEPLVDHRQARQQALDAYQQVRASA